MLGKISGDSIGGQWGSVENRFCKHGVELLVSTEGVGSVNSRGGLVPLNLIPTGVI